MRIPCFLLAITWLGCAGGDATSDDTGRDASAETATTAPEDADSALAVDEGIEGEGAPTCPSPVAADPHAVERAKCTFGKGATPSTTLGSTAAASAHIEHVIVLMKENRGFDHMLGKLHDTLQPDAEAMPTWFANKDATGASVPIAKATTTCISHDPGHQWAQMHNQVNGGAMDGFVTNAASTTGTDGHFALTYYDQTDLPFYYWLASTYALNDRHFASARSGTFPNRNFLLLGTADGVTCTGCGYPSPTTPTIFDSLDAAGITWGAYSDGALLGGTLDWSAGHKGSHALPDFMTALKDGTLPQVAFVDAVENVTDEHPTADIQGGEAWTRKIYQAAVASPLWPSLAMLYTYDEAGGFFDHVPPPNEACLSSTSAKDSKFSELGIRVPMVVISPWARRHYVSHVVQEHTSLTRFIEAVFGLPALTGRDANAGALLDMFDFDCAPMLTPPDAPASGTGGCGGSTVVLTTDKPKYKPSENIVISFKNGPGDDKIDWIGVYAYGEAPHSGSIAWQYIGGTHTGTTMPKAGSITIDGSSVNKPASWPLAAGDYIAYYLVNDGYVPLGSIDFTVAP
ncbi:MAG: phospholipase C [Polyangiales bacterium]